MSFDPEPVLSTLKPFQRATVEYVIGRFQAGAQRFLVADEVGLGKTRVAQGVISVLLSQLSDGERADIIYVCSNAAIARQNLQILNVLHDGEVLPTRLTLLSDPRTNLHENGVNFIALTPGTSFDKTGGLGLARERALVHHLLRGKVHATRLKNLLRGTVRKKENWQRYLDDVPQLGAGYREETASVLMAGDMEVSIRDANLKRSEERNPITKALLQRLAAHSLTSLRPKLIIFDEFQKFRDLFSDTESEAQALMQQFLRTEHHGAKILFLSATPYKMLTIKGDDPEQGDHQEDFLAAIRMLHGGGEVGNTAAKELKAEMRLFRENLRCYAQGLPNEAAEKRNQVEDRLRGVMSRQERVAATSTDAGLRREEITADIRAEDLRQALAVDRVARQVGGHNRADYWKSAPYLFSFMPGEFDLARKIAGYDKRADLASTARSALLSKRRIHNFEAVPADNGRMRALMENVFKEGELHRRLWLPASLPYLSGQPPLTKSLVFSDWQMVPEAIAALTSHEAERRLRHERGIKGPAKKKEVRLLRLSSAAEDLGSSMRVMLLLYPSDFLARAVDPLEIWRQNSSLSAEDMLAKAKVLIASALADQMLPPTRGAAPWELIAWLDKSSLGTPDISRPRHEWVGKVREGLDAGSRDDSNAPSLLDQFTVGNGVRASVPASDEAVTFLARVALGSPAVCLLRSLRRYAKEPSPDLASASASIALGFLTMFNHREVRPLLLSGGEEGAWSKVIDYCAQHDLQAVLDEYLFQLTGGKLTPETIPGKPPYEGLARRVKDAVGLRTAQITARNPFTGKSFNMPSHLAARFAANAAKDGEGGQTRLDTLREAFNSPFRPFVLASTSVGQEGLDFHHYCHRIWHWNLPGSPADLEQREGRVQRYLNHAVRSNIATCQVAAARETDGPAWPAMLAAAEEEAQDLGMSRLGMCPHWLYTGNLDAPALIESILPLPPFSREAGLAPWLIKTTALYRLAFGQPRQSDLLAILETSASQDLQSLMIRLAPGDFTHLPDSDCTNLQGDEQHEIP
jgi:Helicase conserved C-terminal domain